MCRGYCGLHCIVHRLHHGKEPSHGTTTESFGCKSLKCQRNIYVLLSFPGHPGNGHLIGSFCPTRLASLADTWADLQQVICDYYLLVDVVGALEVQAETPCLKVLLAHVADDCSLPLFPCSNAFSQALIRIHRELNPDLPWCAHHCLRLLRVRDKVDALECLY